MATGFFNNGNFDFTGESYMQSVTKQIAQMATAEREKLIKKRLIEKGYNYDHLIKWCRFPKVAIVIEGEWTTVYADNGTEQGEVIVKFKEVINYITDENGMKANISFQFI